MKAENLFTLSEEFPFKDSFSLDMHPWEWLPLIKKTLVSFIGFDIQVSVPSGFHVSGDVFIHESVKLPPYGIIEGPAYIGPECELRPGVYIRGNVIAGRGCILGNSCEFKNCLLLDYVQTPHYNYVGDSVLGNKSHLGAGVILSNLRLDQAEINVNIDEQVFETGLRKFGALLGDSAEVGCNTALQPGTILGKKALVVPAIAFKGYLSAGKIGRNNV